jgi:hypothetical protein
MGKAGQPLNKFAAELTKSVKNRFGNDGGTPI